MKKILFIVEDLYGGGAEKVLLNTASLLQENKANVIVYTLRKKIEHNIPENIELLNLAIVNRFTKSISNIFLEKIQASLIYQKILKEAPDVIISCSCDKITRHLPDNLNIYYWIHGNITGFANELTPIHPRLEERLGNTVVIVQLYRNLLSSRSASST